MANEDSRVLAAVALRYLMDFDHAPRVVAKGRSRLAEKIIRLAKANNIPVHEDGDLVHVLMKLDLGAEIPPELYKVVAEVLAFIYLVNSEAKS